MLEHLTDILVGTGVAVLSASIFGVWRISVRTRDLERQHEVLRRDIEKVEEEVTTLLPILARIDALDERCATRCQTDIERSERNDAAHNRIEAGMAREHSENSRHFEKLEAGIESARQERIHQMETLKADLIREFRKNGGAK